VAIWQVSANAAAPQQSCILDAIRPSHCRRRNRFYLRF
jgi:hypothetical protein